MYLILRVYLTRCSSIGISSLRMGRRAPPRLQTNSGYGIKAGADAESRISEAAFGSGSAGANMALNFTRCCYYCNNIKHKKIIYQAQDLIISSTRK
jgi:hypothetical protein